MTLEELLYLLWAIQGITDTNNSGITFRTVSSSGAIHSFGTYLVIMRVKEMQNGVYRYVPVDHKLLFMFELNNIEEKVDAVTLDQPFVRNCAKKAAVPNEILKKAIAMFAKE